MDSALSRRMDALEARVARLEQHLGVGPLAGASAPAPTLNGEPVTTGAPNEVMQHVMAGNTIQAIKAYREATGCGLAEAKAAVERLRGL
jgi:ribosomal protein L7/L12